MKNIYIKNKKFKNYNIYHNTSEAYNYEECYNKVKLNKRKKTNKKRIKYKYSKDKKEHISFSTYLTLFIFFISSIFITISYSIVTIERNNNSLLQKKLTSMEKETYKLSQDLIKSINLEYIENIAKTKLDMKEPESYQIVYINVPKKSYNVQLLEIENKLSSKEKFVKLIKKLVKTIKG